MPKYVVRTGATRALGIMAPYRDETYQRGNSVVVRTDRGLEAGEVLCEATEASLATIKDPAQGQILRRMSTEDLNEHSRLREQERHEFETCKRLIAQEQLQMKLVDVEHLFGGERVVVYYLSE